MKHLKIFIWILAVESLFIGIMWGLEYVSRETYTAPKVTHAQDIWISALEWCESRGKLDAINPKDRDGTPSYKSFQWKPTTFEYYGEKYELIVEDDRTEKEIIELMEYGLQRSILENMVNDKKVKWEQEFPDCVKKKVGRPPVY